MVVRSSRAIAGGCCQAALTTPGEDVLVTSRRTSSVPWFVPLAMLAASLPLIAPNDEMALAAAAEDDATATRRRATTKGPGMSTKAPSPPSTEADERKGASAPARRFL